MSKFTATAIRDYTGMWEGHVKLGLQTVWRDAPFADKSSALSAAKKEAKRRNGMKNKLV